MASSKVDDEEISLEKLFETWLINKLKSSNKSIEQEDQDLTLFTNFIQSALNEEDNSDEEKAEAIRPILQELNQVCLFF